MAGHGEDDLHGFVVDHEVRGCAKGLEGASELVASHSCRLVPSFVAVEQEMLGNLASPVACGVLVEVWEDVDWLHLRAD